MSLIEPEPRVLIQGITGREGRLHTELMRSYGTRIVAGVTPGKGGQRVHGVPVFDSVATALAHIPDDQRPTWSVGFVPAPFAKSAALEVIRAGLNCIIISEHVPVYDSMAILKEAQHYGVRVIGPNCPGIIVPGFTKLGIMPGDVFTPGQVSVVSRSGTLTYEVVSHLTAAHIGQRICVGIGGDPINLTTLAQTLISFEDDPATKAIILIGEIGGVEEERAAAELLGSTVTKPVIAYLAGRTAPPGRRLGHAGALIERGQGTVESKERALIAAGARVAVRPSQVATLVSEVL